MSIFDILAWLVLLYKDRLEITGSVIDRTKFVVTFAVYRLYRFLDNLNIGYSRIDILNSTSVDGVDLLRIAISNILAHSELQSESSSGSLRSSGDEQTEPLLNAGEKETYEEDSPKIAELANSIRATINSSCDRLLELSTEPTTWNEGQKKYLEIYDSVFHRTDDEVDIEASEVPIYSSEMRFRGGRSESTSGTLIEGQKSRTISPAPSPNSRGNINWVSLGFQGADPSTDFRGTGKLGLETFYQFCAIIHPGLVAKTIMIQSHSFNPGPVDVLAPWYSVALVSIHLSQFLITLLKRNSVRPAFYRGILSLLPQNELAHALQSNSVEKSIYSLHSTLLIKFHKVWLQSVATGEIKSVMDTESVLEKFKLDIEAWIWNGNWNDGLNDTYDILES